MGRAAQKRQEAERADNDEDALGPHELEDSELFFREIAAEIGGAAKVVRTRLERLRREGIAEEEQLSLQDLLDYLAGARRLVDLECSRPKAA